MIHIAGSAIHVLLSLSIAGMSEVCVSVTHRITHDTFKGIMELSGVLGKKKKGKGKKGGKKVKGHC